MRRHEWECSCGCINELSDLYCWSCDCDQSGFPNEESDDDSEMQEAA